MPDALPYIICDGCKQEVTQANAAVLDLSSGAVRRFCTYACLQKFSPDDKQSVPAPDEGLMPKTTTITCDQCGNDLTTTGRCFDYRLTLKVDTIPLRNGLVMTAAVYPPPDMDAYFCGTHCLVLWVRKKFGAAQASTPLPPEVAESIFVAREEAPATEENLAAVIREAENAAVERCCGMLEAEIATLADRAFLQPFRSHLMELVTRMRKLTENANRELQ